MIRQRVMMGMAVCILGIHISGIAQTEKPDTSFILTEDQVWDDHCQRFADPYSGIPSGLTVELIRDSRPVKIIDPQPEFSWIVPSGAVVQKAYQVLISSDKDLVEKNIGNMWNSGQIRSNKSSNVSYEGKPLAPDSRYFWKVRIIDEDNLLSEYSEIQQFETGFFGKHITSENAFQMDKRTALTFHKKGDGSYFVDFGKDAFGALEFTYQVKNKKTARIRLGEKLLDGAIDRKPGGSIRYQAVELEFSPEKQHYILELLADERNTNSMAVSLPDSFPVIMPFRYVEIEGLEDLKAENLKQLVYHGYFEDSSSFFSSSDEILDRVWEFCKYSIKATTFAGYYVDGDRERIPYEADAYLNQLSHYNVDCEYALARKTIEYFMVNPTWPTEWQLHVALMFYQDYMYTGNSELIEKYYDQLKIKTLMDLENEEGLISTSSPAHTGQLMAKLGFRDTTERLRDIVDWPQKGGFGGVMGETDDFVFMPVNTVVNSFYYRNMVIMAQFAELLGKTEEALDFRLRAARVKKAMNEKLFDRESAYYTDGEGTAHGSLHANMLPLAFDIVPEEYVPGVVDHIKSRGMACSVYGAQYLMEALYKAGEADYALELMTATHDRSWYHMIKTGSTISMEAWDMKYKPNADWNHAWGAAPANIIPRGLWGIKPKTPGFGIVSIQPQMGKLEQSCLVLPTLKGKIKARYKKSGPQATSYTIELPANMVGIFRMNFPPQTFVSLNGEAVNLRFGSIRLSPGINQVDVNLNSF